MLDQIMIAFLDFTPCSKGSLWHFEETYCLPSSGGCCSNREEGMCQLYSGKSEPWPSQKKCHVS